MGAHLLGRNERLSIIEQLLLKNAAGLRVVEIAEHCEVDRRTIYRDLTVMMESGLPVYHKNGRFFINRDYYLSTIRLNVYEAVSLMLALRILSQHQDQQNPHVVAMFRKLSGSVPASIAQHVSIIADNMARYPIDRGYVGVLETLIRGWCDKRVVKLWDGKITRDFAIYAIEPASFGSLVIIGYDLKSHQLCTLRIRRIKRVKLSKTVYEIAPDFDRLRHMSHILSFTQDARELNNNDDLEEVQLVFSAEGAATLKQKIILSPSQIRRLDDGKYLISLYSDNWRDLLPWIRSWGGHVEVIKPVELRQTIISELDQLRLVYDNRAN